MMDAGELQSHQSGAGKQLLQIDRHRPEISYFSVYCLADSVQHQVHRLLCRSLVGHNAVVIQDPLMWFVFLHQGDFCHCPFLLDLFHMARLSSGGGGFVKQGGRCGKTGRRIHCFCCSYRQRSYPCRVLLARPCRATGGERWCRVPGR